MKDFSSGGRVVAGILARIFATAAAALLLLHGGARAAPALSGHYSVNVNVFCQATPTFAGAIFSKLLDANYDPATATVTVTGWQTIGALVVPSGGTPGLTTTAVSYTSAYTNTDTTLTAAGVTWNIKYGPVDGSGIARAYLSNGVNTAYTGSGNICSGTGTAIRQ